MEDVGQEMCEQNHGGREDTRWQVDWHDGKAQWPWNLQCLMILMAAPGRHVEVIWPCPELHKNGSQNNECVSCTVYRSVDIHSFYTIPTFLIADILIYSVLTSFIIYWKYIIDIILVQFVLVWSRFLNIVSLSLLWFNSIRNGQQWMKKERRRNPL